MTSTLPPLIQAFSGALGGAAAKASAYPLDLVCTRLQTSDVRERQGILSAIDALKEIIKTRGVVGLYDGLETDTAATLISGFCYFYAYSFLRSKIFRRGAAKIPTSLAALEEIAIGFLAGVASRAVSTPLSLVTVLLQSEHNHRDTDIEKGADGVRSGKRSIASIARRIYGESGLRGFWRGFETTTLLCLNPSLTLFLYQAFRRLFLRGKDRQQPSPRQAFVGAAISNVIAVTILYPLLLAKTRLQSGRGLPEGNNDDTNESKTRPRQPETMLDVWRSAYSKDGFSGLYPGLEAQLVKGFLSQGLTMMIKQRLEQVVIALYLYHVRARKVVLAK